jgi:mono/diheme cytochrome c family protein
MRNRHAGVWLRITLLPAGALCCGFLAAAPPVSAEDSDDPIYRVVEGKADARTYNGYRRYNAACNHCHGPDGVGSSFGPSLIEETIDAAAFRTAILGGRAKGDSVMKGFADDFNVAPYVDDILAYLQARADGRLGRGRPARLD